MEHRQNFIGIYDADLNDEVRINNQVIKAKGRAAPKKNILVGHFNIYFAKGFEQNSPQLDGLETAFIDAAQHRNKHLELVGVGYGGKIDIDILNQNNEAVFYA